MPDLSLYSVKAVFILDNEGTRLFAKYYTSPCGGTEWSQAPSVKDQKTFEKGLFSKTYKQNSDVIIYDNRAVLYKQIVDLVLYVVGCADENEAMLYQVVAGLRDSLDILLRHSVDRHAILDNYDLVALTVDEMVDSGIILETDPGVIASRVSRAPMSDVNLNIDLSEQGITNFYQRAKGKLSERLRQQFQ